MKQMNFRSNVGPEQTVLQDGDSIYNNLVDSLSNASKNIIVVSAWFTDESLLSILTEKQKSGVDVHIVIADNSQNKNLKLTF